MSVIYVVIPLAVLLAAAFVAAYAWATRTGQLDDLVTPALRVLTEDDAHDRHGTDSTDSADEAHDEREDQVARRRSEPQKE